MSVTPRGLSVQAAYRDYADGKFLVNRQYQRKLVWTRNEKRKLIDSILKGYPIPLILLATETAADGDKTFEILDGMQRLNAIFEFIENKFDLDGQYFRLEELSRANQRFEEGIFVKPDGPYEQLSRTQCSNLVDYTLAITEFPSTDTAAVNDVFGRINAYGRRLSKQEQRQAGVLSEFTNLVRTLSAEMRGDVSRDTLDLSEMPTISIDPDETYETYGIKADDTFWCEQGILRRNQLRESEDEQVIADLVISILRDEPFAFSGSNLDQYYDSASEQSIEIERLINRIGPPPTSTLLHPKPGITRGQLWSNEMPRYSLERKGAVLKKLLPPENQPVPVVSEAEGISQGTLYNWLCQVKDGGGVVPGSRASNSEQWSSDAKLAVVLETQSLNEAEKAEYCRLKGLYPEQIERWRLACLSGMSSKEPSNEPLKEARNEIKRLKRRMERKDRALAESASLLVLSKKFQALWEDEDQ